RAGGVGCGGVGRRRRFRGCGSLWWVPERTGLTCGFWTVVGRRIGFGPSWPGRSVRRSPGRGGHSRRGPDDMADRLRCRLRASIDPLWLADAARVFPVTVDPNLFTSGTTYVYNTDSADHPRSPTRPTPPEHSSPRSAQRTVLSPVLPVGCRGRG